MALCWNAPVPAVSLETFHTPSGNLIPFIHHCRLVGADVGLFSMARVYQLAGPARKGGRNPEKNEDPLCLKIVVLARVLFLLPVNDEYVLG